MSLRKKFQGAIARGNPPPPISWPLISCPHPPPPFVFFLEVASLVKTKKAGQRSPPPPPLVRFGLGTAYGVYLLNNINKIKIIHKSTENSGETSLINLN